MYENRHSNLPWTLLALTVLLVGQAMCPAHAQRAVPIEELTKASDLVIIGKVENNNAKWIDKKKIVTTSVVRPIKTIKGEDPGELIKITFLGGTVGVISQRVSHEATLREGEVALLFLAKPGAWPASLPKSYRIVDELGKILLVPAGEPETRLENNRRLLGYMKGIEQRIVRGGTP